MLITYKQKLYNNDKNRRIDTLLRRYGVFYNHCIALHKRYYRLFKKYLKLNDLQKHTTKLKKTHRYAFLKTLGSQTLQDLTERIDKAFKKFFKKQAKLPRFKKVANYKSFTFKSQLDKKTGLNNGVGFEIKDNVISFKTTQAEIPNIFSVWDECFSSARNYIKTLSETNLDFLYTP